MNPRQAAPNVEHSGEPFVYYGIQHHTGPRMAKFIRVAQSQVDPEWRQMLRAPGRTWPCIVFSAEKGTETFEAVHLERLRRIGGQRAAAIAQAWDQPMSTAYPPT